MHTVGEFDLGARTLAIGVAPHDHTTADKLGPVLAQILEGLRDIREQLAGAHKAWYTVEEIARLTGRTPYSVRRWVKDGRITAVRVNGTGPRGRLLVAQEQLQRLIAGGLGGEAPAQVGR